VTRCGHEHGHFLPAKDAVRTGRFRSARWSGAAHDDDVLSDYMYIYIATDCLRRHQSSGTLVKIRDLSRSGCRMIPAPASRPVPLATLRCVMPRTPTRRGRQSAARGARGVQYDLHVPADTVCMFNSEILHTATARPTRAERRSVRA
jgi:hypothetical protein